MSSLGFEKEILLKRYFTELKLMNTLKLIMNNETIPANFLGGWLLFTDIYHVDIHPYVLQFL